MNPRTPKEAPTLGVGVLVDSWMFKEWLQGSKPNGLKISLYHWKVIETQMSKMGWHDPFEHLKHKLWPKERLEVKLAVWLPTTKSWESTQFPCVQVRATHRWKAFNQGYNFCFKLHLNRRSAHKVMGPKVAKIPTLGILGLPFGSLETKCHLDVGLMERHKIYYKGEGGGFPQVQAMVNLMSPSLPMARFSTKSAPTMHYHLMLVLCRSMSSWCLSLFLVPSWSSSTPLYPQSVTNQGACLDSLLFRCVQFRFTFESIKEFRSMLIGMKKKKKKKN